MHLYGVFDLVTGFSDCSFMLVWGRNYVNLGVIWGLILHLLV